MSTSLEEITPNFIRWFAEKSVRERIFPDTEGLYVYTIATVNDEIIVTTNMDDRQFRVTRDTVLKEIRLSGDGIDTPIIL